jgi:Flp pilus assembly protein TadD
MSLLIEALKKAEQANALKGREPPSDFDAPAGEEGTIEAPGWNLEIEPPLEAPFAREAAGAEPAPDGFDFPALELTEEPAAAEIGEGPAPAPFEPDRIAPPPEHPAVSPAPVAGGPGAVADEAPPQPPTPLPGSAAGHAGRGPAPEQPAPFAEKTETDLAARRQRAANVFAAKTPPTRARKLILAGAATAALAGGAAFGVYYWQSLPPAAPARPATIASPQPISPAPAPPPAAQPAASIAREEHPAGGDAVPPAPQKAEPTALAQPAAPAGRPRKLAADPAPPHREDSAIHIQHATESGKANPALVAAYQAFMGGDDATAEREYRKILGREPDNRDALLGTAAVLAKRGRDDDATRLYLRLLELDPRDPAALAGLVALTSQGDPVRGESRVKSLLSEQPNAHVLHFTLGNLYAAQSRWAEAQQAFFRAWQGAPDNPDYLYNLAVSLDHLNQPQLALEYYQKALAQAAGRPHAFDPGRVQGRVRELKSGEQGMGSG